MSLTYFRFTLLSRTNVTIFSNQDLGVIRTSYNCEDNSVSVLCDSHQSIEEQQKQWIDYLQNKQIKFEQLECEVLEEEKRVAVHCAHDSQGNQDHEHHHTHEHDHDHDHEHDHEHHHEHHHDHEHAHAQDNHRLKAGIGLLCGIGLLALSIISFNIPMLFYYILTGFSTLLTFYLGQTVYQSAWKAWKEKKWEMSTLYTISTLTIIGMSIASLFVPGLPILLESAPLILGFWHLGEAIEHTLLEKINKNLDIRDCLAKTVVLADSNKTIPVQQLIPNDVIILNTSEEVIPADGILMQPALLRTDRINGCDHPKWFQSGDTVQAGMWLAPSQNVLQMRVTKTYQNSYLSLIAKNMNQSTAEKAPIEQLANTVLAYFVPSLLTIAIISGVAVGLFFPPAIAIQCAVSVLVSACPCVLSIITPTAVKIGMKRAAETGIVYKDGNALQAAADIDTVVFDLNGTLTDGGSYVEERLPIQACYQDDLAYFAHLEDQSPHFLASIIARHLKTKTIAVGKSLEITSLDTSCHSGIQGYMNGHSYLIGNKDMLKAHDVSITAPFDDPTNGAIYLVKNKQIIGQIAVVDRLRQDAIDTIKKLQEMGKDVHICTGSDEYSALQYAKLLNISPEAIYANATGATKDTNDRSKENYIIKLQQAGRKVCMVGDGINDSAALKRANVSVAVVSKSGDKFIQNQAGMVVQQGYLFPIVTALDVAAKTKRNIIQNLSVSLTYNSVITLVAAGLFLTLGFTLNPVIGIALMAVESAIVLANLQRLKYQPIITVSTCFQETTTSKLFKSLGGGFHITAKQVEEPSRYSSQSPLSKRSHIPSGNDIKLALPPAAVVSTVTVRS